jgi:hypothetical protein
LAVAAVAETLTTLILVEVDFLLLQVEVAEPEDYFKPQFLYLLKITRSLWALVE